MSLKRFEPQSSPNIIVRKVTVLFLQLYVFGSFLSCLLDTPLCHFFYLLNNQYIKLNAIRHGMCPHFQPGTGWSFSIEILFFNCGYYCRLLFHQFRRNRSVIPVNHLEHKVIVPYQLFSYSLSFRTFRRTLTS